MDTISKRFIRGLKVKSSLAIYLIAIASWYAVFSSISRVETTQFPNEIIPGQLQVYEDTTHNLTLDQVLGQRSQFKDVSQKTPSYFFSSSAYWFHIPLQNLNSKSAELFLDIKYPTLDFVTLYSVGSEGVREVVNSGDRIEGKDRPYPATDLVIPFLIEGSERLDLFVRVYADDAAILFPHEILDTNSLQFEIQSKRLIHGIIMGLFAAIFMYDLSQFIVLKKSIYFYYLAYIFSTYFIVIALNGLGPALIYPRTIWLANEGLVFFSGLAFSSILLFTREILETYNDKPVDRVIQILIGASMLLAVTPLFLSGKLTYQLLIFMMIAIPLSVFPIAVRAMPRVAGSLFFAIGAVLILISLGIFGMAIMGILPFHPSFLDIIPSGIIMGGLFHFLSASNRVLTLQEEKLQSEIISRQNLEIRQEELEHLVTERTVELDSARQKAEQLAVIDPLTGIYNRRGLFDAAEREIKIAERNKRPFSVIMFDIDYFKHINDFFGHAEGDRVLCNVVSAVLQEIRTTDLFGRLGGDEFLIVLPETPSESATQIAERVRLSMVEKNIIGDPSMLLTASLGIAWVVNQNYDLESLQSSAVSALYRAKNNGRNRIETIEVIE